MTQETRVAELKNCPFCRGEGDADGVLWERVLGEGVGVKQGRSPACLECGASVETVEEWNTRPIEDDLRAKLKIAEEALHQAEKTIYALKGYLPDIDDQTSRGESIRAKNNVALIRTLQSAIKEFEIKNEQALSQIRSKEGRE